MKLNKNIVITITPDEAKEIIINHIKNVNGFYIDNVEFDITPEYDHEYGNDEECHTLTSITCTGTLE